MNGCASLSFNVVNAEDHSMGGVVEGGIGNADDTSPRKVVIKKVQTELSQKYRARDETKQELEFLEKGGNLLDYKLQYAASATVHSTSITDLQHDQLVTNDAIGGSALVTSSHGDSVGTSGGPGVVPSEANSADNPMYFDAETDFSEGGQSLHHPCRSDVPLEPLLNINATQKHEDSAVSTLPRKAYKRRCRSRPSRDGARSSSMKVDTVGTSLLCHPRSRDVKDLESEGEKHDTILAVLSSSVSPVEGRNETSGEPLLNDLGGLKSVESIKNPVECVSQTTRPDYNDNSNPLHEQRIQEQQSSAPRSPKGMGSDGLEGIEVVERKTLSVSGSQLSLTSRSVDDQMIAHERNGFKKEIELDKSTDVLTSDPHAAGVLESNLVNRATGINNGRSNTSERVTTVNNIDSFKSNKSHVLPDKASVMDIHESVTSKKDHEGNENLSLFKQETDHGPQNIPKNGLLLQSIEDSTQSISNSSKLLANVAVKSLGTCHSDMSEPGREHVDPLFENPNAHNETSCSIRHEESVDANSSVCDSKLAGIIDENSILKEAQLIEARRKRFAEFSMVVFPAKIQRRSHWDYVLEEMAWLSNDFAQERMWKIAAAAKTSFNAAVACRSRKEAKISGMDAKIVARTLAKAVMEFWNSVVVQGTGEMQQKNPRNNPIRAYAAKIIVSHKPSTLFCQADLPIKQDGISDWELPDLLEENAPYVLVRNFYTAPPGAMGIYRSSVIAHMAHIEKTGSYVQEESEMSTCDVVVDFESQDNLYGENEGETRTLNAFDLSAVFESNMASRYGRKKLKHLKHRHSMGSCEASSDLPLQRSEIKLVKREPGSLAKWPGSGLNASFPTKRVRTATRRVIGSFSAGPPGSFLLQNKADASSGDTSSLQDDLSTFHAEVSMMPKKKKAKHMNYDYDPQWQAGSSFQEEQRDRFRRRSEAHLLESNGNGGIFGQPIIKKPKSLRQPRDPSYDNFTQTGISLPSPVASQFSNMHHQDKFVKILGRDYGRKAKGPKIPSEQPISGIPWSIFEDQALVVLVHDHGPNWELICDAFNSALHFKCIFRNAEECKERHHILMDRNSCDGADSAEELGPSQSYPSALPGIPKGSARQLFQRLLGPIEEDTLKSHFEKIITIGQKLLLRRSQDPKQLIQPHSSHLDALSQVFPNNLNGGHILTPLDLCDVVQAPDIFPTGMQVAHTTGSTGANQGMNNPLLPASPGSALQGSPNMTTGTSFSSPGFANSSPRDGRNAIPRGAPLSAEEQQKIQHYNQVVPGRNTSPATLPSHGALAGNDRGVRAMGMISSANRSFPMARPGLPATSTSLVNPGTIAPSAVSPNLHAGLVTGIRSPMPRSNDALQLMRPGTGPDSPSPRQIATGVPHPWGLSSPLPSQTVSSPVSPYSINHQKNFQMSQRPQAQNASYFEGQVNHAPGPNPQPQAYGPRFSKERQLQQQRMMLQTSQQQFAASNSMVRQMQTKPQLPLPSPIPTATQPQPSKSSPVNFSSLPSSSSMSSVPQHQQKHQAVALGVVQNTQSGGNVLENHIGKQQGRQHHLPQSSRHHPQRQQLQAPQQVKVAKGGSTGNIIRHPGDSPVSNGVMTSSVTQPLDKREAGSQSMKNQSLNTGSTLSGKQPSRPSNSVPQQKFSGQGTSAMKHIQTLKSDNGNQVHALPVAVPAANDGQQSCSPSDGILNLPNNQGSAMSMSSNLYDTMSQEGQGLDRRQSTKEHDANEQRQQQLQVQEPPSQILQMQNPSQSGHAPQQSQLLQTGNGNLHGRPSDPRLE